MKSRISLKGYLSLHFGFVAMLPVITMALLVWFFIMPAMQHRTEIQHQTIAHAIAGHLSAYLKGGQRQLTALAGFLQNRNFLADPGLVDLLDAQCGQGEFFEALFIVDSADDTIHAVGLVESRRSKRDDFIGLDFSGRPLIDPADGQKRVSWSKTFLSTVSRRMAISLSVPLVHGFIMGEITLDNLSEFISLIPLESECLILLIDSQGLIVADSQKRYRGQALSVNDPAAVEVEREEQTASSAFELEGEKMVGTLVAMDTLDWRVLVAQPFGKASQPLRDTFALLGLGLAIALGLALSVSWYLTGNLAMLFSTYAEKAQAIANGSYQLQWPEARTIEFSILGQSLRRMADKISRREKEQADSEQRLKDLVANVPGVVYQFTADPKRSQSYLSTVVLREQSMALLGLDSEPETYFDDFVACLPEEDRPLFILSVNEVVEQFKPWYYEGRFNKPSGATIWLEGRSVPRKVGDKIVFYGLFTDITRRKEMESKLRLSQFIFDKANIGIYRIDMDGQIREVNPKAAALLGYTKEELETLSITDVDPLIASETWGANWRKLVAQGMRTLERQHRRKDNALIPVTIHSNILEYEGQQYAIAFVQDISKRKQIEESLRLTQFIFDKAPIGIWRMGDAGEVLDVNEQGCASLGYSRELLCGMSVFDFAPGFGNEDWVSGISRLKDGETVKIEALHRRKSGEIFPIEVISKPLRFEGRWHHLAFVQDITERKRMEQALKESEQRLDLALSGANEGIWDWHIHQGTMYFDSRYYTMAGYRPGEFPSAFEEWEKRVHRDDIEGVKSVIDRYLAGDLETFVVEFRFLRKDGGYMWIQGRGKIVEHDDAGHPARFIGTHSDITDRKRMEEALEKRIVALTQPLEDVGGIAFEDLFSLSDIQRLQDLYAEAFGVAALITHPDGTPITIPSNFTVLCGDIIRKTEKGLKNCNYSDAMVGRHNPAGPNIQSCLSAGLCNAGASITVGGRHIANWLIGQVRNEAQKEEDIMAYAREIGADETAFRSAYQQVPTMSGEQFERVAWVLFTVANQLSLSAYQNVQQARFITQRKQAEEELRQLRNYLSNIIDSMPSILVAVDRDGKVTQWNQQTEATTGLSFNAARRQPLAKVFPRLAGEMARIHTSIRERRVISSPKVAHEMDQETRFEDITIFPLVANGVDGAVIRVDDVTEKVRLEEMMIQSEKMLSVGGLAAGMAHEINNPLAGILQSAEILETRLMGDLPANRAAAVAAGTTLAAIRHYLVLRKLPGMIENIRESGTRAATIVRNMLSFARKSDRVVSSHDLGMLLDQALELVRTDYSMKKHYDFKLIEIKRQYDAAAGPVPCEASKIQQVFMNILKNGAEAMAEATHAAAPPVFILRVCDDGVWVRVEIEDNGPGMDEKIRRRIFEPFFTTKPVGKGTGLGLSVSYFIIAKDHGGAMDVQAVEGGGTRFVVRLPKAGKGSVSEGFPAPM